MSHAITVSQDQPGHVAVDRIRKRLRHLGGATRPASPEHTALGSARSLDRDQETDHALDDLVQLESVPAMPDHRLAPAHEGVVPESVLEVAKKIGLASETCVEGSHASAGAVDDLLNGGALEAALRQQLERRPDDGVQRSTGTLLLRRVEGRVRS